MNKKGKKIILIMVLLFLLTLTIVGILIWRNIKDSVNNSENENSLEENIIIEKYVDILEDGTKLNNSSKLKEVKKLDEYEISNIQLTYTNGIATVLADVTNTTSTDITNITEIVLILLDDDGNILEEVNGIIGPVSAGETVQLNVNISADYANAYDFKVEKK